MPVGRVAASATLASPLPAPALPAGTTPVAAASVVLPLAPWLHPPPPPPPLTALARRLERRHRRAAPGCVPRPRTGCRRLGLGHWSRRHATRLRRSRRPPRHRRGAPARRAALPARRRRTWRCPWRSRDATLQCTCRQEAPTVGRGRRHHNGGGIRRARRSGGMARRITRLRRRPRVGRWGYMTVRVPGSGDVAARARHRVTGKSTSSCFVRTHAPAVCRRIASHHIGVAVPSLMLQADQRARLTHQVRPPTLTE